VNGRHRWSRLLAEYVFGQRNRLEHGHGSHVGNHKLNQALPWIEALNEDASRISIFSLRVGLPNSYFGGYGPTG
jgi:hypothetical protein